MSFTADRVIIACGGKAYPSLGSDGNLYCAIIQQLGHRLHPILPALAPVTADMRKLKGLQGVRLDADVSLLTERQVDRQNVWQYHFHPIGD